MGQLNPARMIIKKNHELQGECSLGEAKLRWGYLPPLFDGGEPPPLPPTPFANLLDPLLALPNEQIFFGPAFPWRLALLKIELSGLEL